MPITPLSKDDQILADAMEQAHQQAFVGAHSVHLIGLAIVNKDVFSGKENFEAASIIADAARILDEKFKEQGELPEPARTYFSVAAGPMSVNVDDDYGNIIEGTSAHAVAFRLVSELLGFFRAIKGGCTETSIRKCLDAFSKWHKSHIPQTGCERLLVFLEKEIADVRNTIGYLVAESGSDLAQLIANTKSKNG